jgi:hypothetical protein
MAVVVVKPAGGKRYLLCCRHCSVLLTDNVPDWLFISNGVNTQ